MTRAFRFRPRFRGLALVSMAIGAALVVTGLGFASGAGLVFALVCGGVGLSLGVLYLASPAWKIEVRVDDEALEVASRGDRRFRVAWAEIERVVVAPDRAACFVDGGDPAQSLLVPGPGAPAPYDIEDRAELIDAILSRAPASVVEESSELTAGPRRSS